MARDGGVSCLRSSEMMSAGLGGIETPALDLDEVHVLAVDDSVVDRIVIEKMLRNTSCKVTAVESGWRALEILGLDSEKASDRLKVDLIITDYCMPGMTGYELLKKIKKSSNFREVPVVIMSSENVMTRINRCLEEGAEDFLLKPVQLDDVKRLRSHLNKDVKLPNGNKRKLPEDSNSILPPSPPLTISPESSDSSPPLSPVEIFSSPLSSLDDVDDDDNDDELTTSPEASPTSEESPIRRQKMKSPGLD